MKEIWTISEISAALYLKKISVKKMSRMLGVESSRLHAMFKYRDEEHNKLLRLACTYLLKDEEAAA